MGSSLSSGLKEFSVSRERQRSKQRPTVYYGVAPYPAWGGGWGRREDSVESFLKEGDSEQNLKGQIGVRSRNGWEGYYSKR